MIPEVRLDALTLNPVSEKDRAAARATVARHALDAADRAQLLDMLGLGGGA